MIEINEESPIDELNYDYNMDESYEENENKINLNESEGTIFLDESEIFKEREKMISEAKETFYLERDDAILVMIYYQWNIDKSENWYENVEQNRINAGIELSKELIDQFNKEKIESNGNICLICSEEKNKNNNLFSLNCGHQFCEDCWAEYLKEKIKFPLNALQAKCPQKNCTCVVYEKFYSKFLKDQNSLKILNKAIYKNFIDINPDIKQCPNKYCIYYIKSNIHSAREINCLCGTSYCFKCSRESHNPCPCEMNKKWLEVNKEFYYISNDEEKSNKWIAAYTKECPNCHQKIERSKGCNYMLCDKKVGGCGHAFCYVCETEWSKHSKDHFKCNRYTEEVKQKEKKAEKLKEELEIELLDQKFYELNIDYPTLNGKLGFYYYRYKNMQSSIEICNNTIKNNLIEKINLLTSLHNLDYNDVQFINDALECVINSKRILKNSYMFGYYMKDTEQKKLFENSQGKLEYNTEDLHKLLIDGKLDLIIRTDTFDYKVLFTNYKISVINLIDTVNKYRNTFVEEIENKYISYIDNELIDY